MGFVTIFWKNDVQEAYLPKKGISGQIVSEIVAHLCLENPIQTRNAAGREKNLPAACRLFSRGVIFTRTRVLLALLSLRKNGGLLVV